MAKIVKKIKMTKPDTELGLIAVSSFNTLQTSVQKGDVFFVPNEEALVILGNNIESRDRSGNLMRDDEGNVVHRTVGHYFPAVRVVDGKPVEITNLYVGQLVKMDIYRVPAFNNKLLQALRQGDAKFKEIICGKMLIVNDEKLIKDRVYDAQNNTYLRNEDGSYKSVDKMAYNFEPMAASWSSEAEDRAYSLLEGHYRTTLKDVVSFDDDAKA